MRKIKLVSVLVISFLVVSGSILASRASSPSLLGISIIMTSKAYWDGPTKSCLPRDKGFCCHVSFNTMPVHGQILGEIEISDANSMVLTIAKTKGLDRETFMEYFTKDKFMLNGPITFSPEILEKLKLPLSYSIPAGEYSYSVAGDVIRVFLK
jgi:hypothetical protein